MKATFLSLVLGFASGCAGGSTVIFGAIVFMAVSLAKEPPSPIHHAPIRPSFDWVSEGFCKPFSNECRIAGMGGTPQ